MNFKKYFVGASAMLIIFTNSFRVSAEEVEIFGEQFGNSQPAPTPSSETFTPSEEVATPPQENSQPVEVATPPQENSQPVEVVTPPQENSQPVEVVTPPQENSQPVEVITPPQENSQPAPTPPSETFTPSEEVATPPQENSQPVEVVTPFEQNNSEGEDFGDSLTFNDWKNQPANPEVFTPPENPSEENNNGTVTVITPRNDNSSTQRRNENTETPSTNSAPKSKLKNLKQRFVQVAVDENYIYYLDKQSVTWKKIPYMNSEYMADVWVRMIERNQDTSDMPQDLADYINDTNSDEIALAKAQGYQYMPEDQKVLQHKRYFLERYYLRPKTEQIQFICELEVVGHPQNTSKQRKYDYQNWEELIPGSIESILYRSIIQVIGKGKASERGHMTLFDMVEEYGRISVR